MGVLEPVAFHKTLKARMSAEAYVEAFTTQTSSECNERLHVAPRARGQEQYPSYPRPGAASPSATSLTISSMTSA